jgi:hypothetical protein
MCPPWDKELIVDGISGFNILLSYSHSWGVHECVLF